jgi:hypothetical protein
MASRRVLERVFVGSRRLNGLVNIGALLLSVDDMQFSRKDERKTFAKARCLSETK